MCIRDREEALIEMYLTGVSVCQVEDITEALWGSKVSPATISELNKLGCCRLCRLATSFCPANRSIYGSSPSCGFRTSVSP